LYRADHLRFPLGAEDLDRGALPQLASMRSRLSAHRRTARLQGAWIGPLRPACPAGRMKWRGWQRHAPQCRFMRVVARGRGSPVRCASVVARGRGNRKSLRLGRRSLPQIRISISPAQSAVFSVLLCSNNRESVRITRRLLRNPDFGMLLPLVGEPNAPSLPTSTSRPSQPDLLPSAKRTSRCPQVLPLHTF